MLDALGRECDLREFVLGPSFSANGSNADQSRASYASPAQVGCLSPAQRLQLRGGAIRIPGMVGNSRPQKSKQAYVAAPRQRSGTAEDQRRQIEEPPDARIVAPWESVDLKSEDSALDNFVESSLAQALIES